MLKQAAKKDALEKLKETNEAYQTLYTKSVKHITELHDLRMKCVEVLKELEEYVSKLANHPKDFDVKIGRINTRRNEFENSLEKLILKSKKEEKIVMGGGASVALAGVGVATLGPTAALAVAMTFGTASTGTAIATLSGAAAMNAALAWLGGGALVAGGAGIIGGEAILALMGPVGWTISGAAFLGSGYLQYRKNNKIIEKAERSIEKILRENQRIKETDKQVQELQKMTYQLFNQVNNDLKGFRLKRHYNYTKFSTEDKNRMIALLNTAQTLAVKIGETINA